MHREERLHGPLLVFRHRRPHFAACRSFLAMICRQDLSHLCLEGSPLSYLEYIHAAQTHYVAWPQNWQPPRGQNCPLPLHFEHFQKSWPFSCNYKEFQLELYLEYANVYFACFINLVWPLWCVNLSLSSVVWLNMHV